MIKMLVVDDEGDVCDFVQVYFEDRGMDVSVAHSAEEAVSSIKQRTPDVVLLDIKMQGMDRLDVLRYIKESNPKVKVIMITAVKDSKVIKKTEELGADGYLTKAFTPTVWEETIMRVVGEGR